MSRNIKKGIISFVFFYLLCLVSVTKYIDSWILFSISFVGVGISYYLTIRKLNESRIREKNS